MSIIALDDGVATWFARDFVKGKIEMEFVKKENIKALKNPGVISRQILNPENPTSARVTITEVHLAPDAIQVRHMHDSSEQIWYAVKGKGTLLLANDEEKNFTQEMSLGLPTAMFTDCATIRTTSSFTFP